MRARMYVQPSGMPMYTRARLEARTLAMLFPQPCTQQRCTHHSPLAPLISFPDACRGKLIPAGSSCDLSMPKGKPQSPFLGRHEKMDSACPILYPRWTTAGGKETLDAAALAKGKSQKRRRTEDTAEASPGSTGTTEAGLPSAEKFGREDKVKNQKKARQNASTEKAVLSSGPGNASEALEMRQKLGYDAVQSKEAVAPGTFGFQFGLTEPSTDQATLDLVEMPLMPSPPDKLHAQAGAGSRQKAKRKHEKLNRQADDSVQPSADTAATSPEPAQQPVPRRVFVGGMPFSMEEEDVREYWSECGEIESLDLMRFPDTGRFKGIAFITFAQEEGCQAALQCQGEHLQDQTLRVEPCLSVPARASAKAQKAAAQEAVIPAAKAAPAAAPKTPGYPVVYVGNIPFTVTAQQLRAFFQQCQVSKVRLHTDRHSGKFRGFAHVHLADEASADRAVELNGQELEGRQIKIGYAQPKK